MSVYAPRQTAVVSDLANPDPPRRLYPAIIWNLVFLPLGYYYLRDFRRFWIFTGVALLMSLYLTVLFRFAPRAFWGLPTMVFYAASVCAYLVFVIRDTVVARNGSQQSRAALFRRPHAYWFLVLFVTAYLLAATALETVRDGILKAHTIPSRSMTPSLMAGDYVFVDYLVRPQELRAGDIVAYEPPDSPGRTYLHRLIALPGDRVRLFAEETRTAEGAYRVLRIERNGTTLPLRAVPLHKRRGQSAQEAVYGLALPIETDFDAIPSEIVPSGPALLFEEQIDGRRHLILEGKGGLFLDVALPSTLGPDQYLVLGDNRDDSKDSRSVGPVRLDRIRGRYMYTYFSLNWHDRSCLAYRRLVDEAGRKVEIPQQAAESACPNQFFQRLSRAEIRWHRLAFIAP